MYSLSWETTIVSDYHLLNYFDIYGRKEPQSMNHIPSTFARGCPEKSFFAYLQETPGVFHRFARGMKFMEIQAPATGLYDFTWLVEKAEREKTERKVFVDVGGGRGQAIMAIHDKFPGIPLDRCVLQDRAEVIKVVEAAGDEKIKEVQKVAIDFLVSQPVQGTFPPVGIRRIVVGTGGKAERTQEPWSTLFADVSTATATRSPPRFSKFSPKPWLTTASCSSWKTLSPTRRIRGQRPLT